MKKYVFYPAFFFFFFLFFNSFGALSENLIFEEILSKDDIEKVSKLEEWAYHNLFYKEAQEKVRILNEFEVIAKKRNDEITLRTINFYRAYYVIALDSKKIALGLKLMKQIIVETEKNGNLLQAAYFRHVLGYYYFTSNSDYELALQNMLSAHYQFSKVGYYDIFDTSGMLNRLAYLYYHLSNYDESLKYFKLSLKYPFSNSRNYISTLNAIGQSYKETYELDSAKYFLKKSQELAVEKNDSAWIVISSNELSKLYLNKKNLNEAIQFIKIASQFSNLKRDKISYAEVLTNLAYSEILNGNSKNALILLNNAEQIFSNNQKFAFEDFKRKQYFHEVYSLAFENNGDVLDALKNIQKSNLIQDSIAKRALISKNISINQSFEYEQNKNKFNILENEKETIELKQKFTLLVFFLFLVIVLLFFKIQKRKKKLLQQSQKLLTFKNQQIKNDLLQAKQILNEYLNSLREKNNLLEVAQKELLQLKKDNQDADFDYYQVIQKLNQSTILTEEDWIKFKKLFEKAHIGFFVKLKNSYPNLTPAEIRLVTLIKLGINSNEMAAMLGISLMGIKKNRQRLRKKINLNEGQKLDDIFDNF